jgi:UDP-N-acetylglucosamine--N-acetylmuramyl-(pentapeptide) pyrophosphoryl-undecaprenol N-acetylglucosamine transferase
MRAWNLPLNARVILVFGGSQGSHAINEVIAEWAPHALPDGWFLIWATGRTEFDQYGKFAGPRIRIVTYLSPIANAYEVANVAIVRGGMMGTAELCAWGVPMVIVPLPTAAADHQTWNAKSLDAAGAAVHLPQSALDARRLDDVIRPLVSDRARLMELSRSALAVAKPTAAADIAQRIASLLPEPAPK